MLEFTPDTKKPLGPYSTRSNPTQTTYFPTGISLYWQCLVSHSPAIFFTNLLKRSIFHTGSVRSLHWRHARFTWYAGNEANVRRSKKSNRYVYTDFFSVQGFESLSTVPNYIQIKLVGMTSFCLSPSRAFNPFLCNARRERLTYFRIQPILTTFDTYNQPCKKSLTLV